MKPTLVINKDGSSSSTNWMLDEIIDEFEKAQINDDEHEPIIKKLCILKLEYGRYVIHKKNNVDLTGIIMKADAVLTHGLDHQNTDYPFPEMEKIKSAVLAGIMVYGDKVRMNLEVKPGTEEKLDNALKKHIIDLGGNPSRIKGSVLS